MIYTLLREKYPNKQIEYNDNTKEYTLKINNIKIIIKLFYKNNNDIKIFIVKNGFDTSTLHFINI